MPQRKKIKTSTQVNGNKNSNITVNNVFGTEDELSFEKICSNCHDVSGLEDAFTDRIAHGRDVLTRKLLPRPLQSDFKVDAGIVDGELKFRTVPVTPSAYEKFPPKMTCSVSFGSQEEAQNFLNNGLKKLQQQADATRRPVEIPYNINNMKEFIGQFEDPVSCINRDGVVGARIYISPRPLPKAKKVRISITSTGVTFEALTYIQLSECSKDKMVLTNDADTGSSVSINIIVLKSEESAQALMTLSMRIRENFKDDIEANKNLLKFRFLTTCPNIRILVFDTDDNIALIDEANMSGSNHNMIEINGLKNAIALLDKVSYIATHKRMNISHDLEYFIKNKGLIDIIYNDSVEEEYKLDGGLSVVATLNDTVDIDEMLSHSGEICLEEPFKDLSLFGARIALDNLKPIMRDSKITVLQNRKVRFESDKVYFVRKNAPK